MWMKIEHRTRPIHSYSMQLIRCFLLLLLLLSNCNELASIRNANFLSTFLECCFFLFLFGMYNLFICLAVNFFVWNAMYWIYSDSFRKEIQFYYCLAFNNVKNSFDCTLLLLFIEEWARLLFYCLSRMIIVLVNELTRRQTLLLCILYGINYWVISRLNLSTR